MACSNGCGTSCSTDCTHSSSGGCGGSCGGSCSTNCTGGCSGYCDGTCKGGSGSTCSDCTAKCANDCTGACTNACVTGCTGCGNNCDGDCTSACAQRCSNDCNAACTATCAYDCEHTCTASCANDCTSCGGSCSSNCSGNCDSGCYTGCYGCDSTCSGGCSGTCNTTCTTTCANDCTGGCKGTCTGGCGGSCDNSCGFSCEASCDNNCTAVCSVSSVYGGNSEKSVLNFAYTGKAQSVTLEPGKYVLECWGAQGGYRSNSSYGGKGGYSTGTLTLTQKTTIYIYVGGSGNSVTSASNSIYPGGFNGGGYRYNYKGGGGATDIRIGSASLYARVIVAGGGGSDGSPNYSGGYAGGVSGTRGNFGCGSYGYGGSQTASYSSLSAINSQGTTNSSSNCAAGFGFGGFGCYYASGYGGAGGGGWYGGQGTYPDGSGDDDGGGGGGSGYVYTSSSASNYPQGCLLNSSYYLSDASNLSGNESFKSPSGSTETGHSDNGYCRITCYIKKKTLHCKMNNEIKKAAPVFMKMNNKIYDAGANAVMDFAYTGTAQAISLPRGQYIIECWGAQGGYRSSSDYGGKGGYSVGTLTLTQSTDLYIYVGGAGNSSTTRLSNNSSIYEGGFNGGGHRYDYKGGGGATDVRIGKDSLYARIIVAGGGGSDGATNKKGMYGGGLEGGSTTESCGSGGYGGTQTGNTWLTTTRSTNASYDTASCYAGFGFGGNGNYASSGYGGAGGGGWYGGGGAGYTGGSSGGSGYVYTSVTASNYPNGCLLNSSYYLSNAQTIAGDQSFPAPSGSTETGHSGNGHVKITKLSDVIYLTHAKNNIMDFNYTGSVQSKTLKPGTYTIECWGGQGGTYSSYIGGYGGYSKGTITLTEATTVYISVGGAGSSSSTAAGFNGGGTGISSGRGGGGATDVRIGQNSLYSRVIVAGGGGGAGVTSANANPCGCGGGEYGGDGYYNDTTGSYTIGQNRCGGSASQTAGGKTWSTSTQATFGQGGNASGYSCGGGGGGWYGGGGAYDSDSDSDGRWGGGGSGYVYTSSTAKNYPNGCLLNSTHYLTNAQTIAGNTSFTSPTGSAETGHTGSGFCRITNLNPTQYGLYVKTNSGWKHIDL